MTTPQMHYLLGQVSKIILDLEVLDSTQEYSLLLSPLVNSAILLLVLMVSLISSSICWRW